MKPLEDEADFLRAGYWMVPVCWMFFILGYAYFFGSSYIGDTYIYLMIGKRLFAGLGYTTSSIYDFYSSLDPTIARAYPPVQPLLYGLTDRLFSTGIASTLLVNLALLYGVVWSLFCLSRETVSSALWYVLFIGIIIFSLFNIPLMEDVVAGKSIVTALLIVLNVIRCAVVEPYTARNSLLMGVLLGLLYLTRFDSTLFVLVYPLGLTWAKRLGPKQWLLIYAGIVCTIFPWTMRNIIIFHTPFTSNSSIAVQSLYYLATASYYDANTYTAFSNPQLWLEERLMWMASNFSLILEYFTPCGLIGVIFAAGCVLFRRGSRAEIICHTTLLWSGINLILVSLPLNDTRRYFAILSVLVFYCCLTTLALLAERIFKMAATKRPAIRFFPNAFFSLVVVLGAGIYYHDKFGGDLHADKVKAVVQDFKPYIHSGDVVGAYNEEQLSYYSGWKTITLPYNFYQPDPKSSASPTPTGNEWKKLFMAPMITTVTKDLLDWRNKFHVRYVIVERDSNLARLNSLPPLAAFDGLLLLDANGFRASE